MVHKYRRKIRKMTEPEKRKGSCHENLTEGQKEQFEAWREKMELDNKSNSTMVNYMGKTSTFLRTVEKETSDIGKRDVRDFLSKKGQSTRNAYKSALKQFFEWYYLDYQELEREDVPRFVEREFEVSNTGKDKVDPEDVPEKEEIETLMETAWNYRDRALVALLSDKGMRISEALKLDVSDVYFDEAGIYLMVPEAKKNYESYRKNRLTWSKPALKDWLEAHPGKHEEKAPLFMDRQGENRLTYSGASQALNRMKKKCDVSDNITLHKFRHYSTTQDRQKKHMRDSYIVKDKGWDDPSQLERYDHLTDKAVDKAHIKQMVEEGQLDKSVLEDLEDGNGGSDQKIQLIACPNCGEKNSPDRDLCDKCNQPFTDEGISKQRELREALDDYIEEKDIMEKLAGNL